MSHGILPHSQHNFRPTLRCFDLTHTHTQINIAALRCAAAASERYNCGQSVNADEATADLKTSYSKKYSVVSSAGSGSSSTSPRHRGLEWLARTWRR